LVLELHLGSLLLRLHGFLPQGLGLRAVLRLRRSGGRGGAGSSFRAAGRGSTDNSRRAVVLAHPPVALHLLLMRQPLHHPAGPGVAVVAVALVSAGYDLQRAARVSKTLVCDSADYTPRVAAVPLGTAVQTWTGVGAPGLAEVALRRGFAVNPAPRLNERAGDGFSNKVGRPGSTQPGQGPSMKHEASTPPHAPQTAAQSAQSTQRV
jgi:hypothetical protein